MHDNYNAWKYAFSAHDIQIEKNDYFLMEGMSTTKVAESILLKFNKDTSLSGEIVRQKEKYYLEHNSFSLYEGVEDLIAFFKEAGYKLGIVSGGNAGRISKLLSADFLAMFDAVITGDAVQECKPHAESYIKAANVIETAPGVCIAVENAPMGIESAKSAGMYCIAVSSTLEKKFLQRADRVIDNIGDLAGILG